jgi:large subunit ribosomal protein L31e
MAEQIKQEASKSAVEKEVKTEKAEGKIELKREYVVPLRQGFMKVPKYRRAKKAILVLRQFLAKHMKVKEGNIRNVRIDRYLNEELWFRGIKKPLHKIKVIATKIDGMVYAELAEIPEAVKWHMQKDAKRHAPKTTEMKHTSKNDHKEEANKETKEDENEKDKSVAEAGLKENKKQAKVQKQTEGVKHEKHTTPFRQVLER